MSRGVGMKTGYRINDWYALCDRCQKKFYASDLKKEWTGWQVCKSCWEPRHPQEFLKGKADNPQVPWTRPDTSTDGDIEIIGDADQTLTIGVNNNIQLCNIELTANRTVTVEHTNATSGDTFIITRSNSNSFILYIKDAVTLVTAVLFTDSTIVIRYNGISWQAPDYKLSSL